MEHATRQVQVWARMSALRPHGAQASPADDVGISSLHCQLRVDGLEARVLQQLHVLGEGVLRSEGLVLPEDGRQSLSILALGPSVWLPWPVSGPLVTRWVPPALARMAGARSFLSAQPSSLCTCRWPAPSSTTKRPPAGSCATEHGPAATLRWRSGSSPWVKRATYSSLLFSCGPGRQAWGQRTGRGGWLERGAPASGS